MNARLIRIVVAVAATSVVSVAGAGMANASTERAAEAAMVSAIEESGGQTTHTAAEYLQQLHTYIQGAVTAEDVAAVEAAIAHLRPVLGVVAKAPVDRAAAVLNEQTDAKAAQVERELPGLTLLAPITGLVTSLLTTLLDLVTGLLGGLPLPLPLPLPELPLPLPELPGVPLPEVPGAPEMPEAPAAPEAPALPEAPLPDVPLP
jgi:hypothetical protein